MTWVTYRKNIADVRKDQLIYVGNAKSVNDALQRAFGEHVPTEPFIVEVNGVPVLRAEWDNALHATDTLTVTLVAGALPAAVSTALIVASLLGYAYISYKLATLPSVATAVGAGVPDAPPSFTFAGQKNIQRLNNVIDNVYGRMRWWPAYLCAPYVVYENSRPVLHVKLSLGLGNFDIEDVRVNDTSLSAIGDAQYTKYNSGAFTASDDAYDGVYYAEDLDNKELLATDEEGHTALGAYLLNPANTVAKDVLVNFVYPSGLFTVTGGAYAASTVTLRVVLAEVDGEGASTGATQTFNFTHTKTARNVYRVTEHCTPSLSSFPNQTGRYKITVVRTDARDGATGAQDAVRVESAFAVCTSGRSYNVSVLAVQLPGTSLVGTDAAEKINVVATRQLNYPKDGVWQAAIATVNPAWIALDILRKEYGAAVALEDLDLPYWEELAQSWQQHAFSYRFEQETTVWDALQAIAAVTRSHLFRLGTDVRFAPASAVKQPVAVFTPDNTQSLELSFGFKSETENDCIEAAYIDATTGTQDSIFFTPPGSSASNPTKVTYAGVTDRQEAWRLAAYEYLSRTVTRDTVALTTGLDGQIPLKGDVILVTWPFPSWETAGIVTAYDKDTNVATLSEAVPFPSGWLAFRKADGTAWGPVKYTRLSDAVVQVLSELNTALDFTGFTGEPVAYTLGDSTVVTKRFQVVNASVKDEDSVQIEAEEFSPSVFAYDNMTAPARGDDMLPYPVATVGVPWLRVLDESGQFLRVEVGPVFGVPTSVGITYLYKELASVPDAGLLDPTFYDGEHLLAPSAEQVGSSYYVPRQEGALFLRARTVFPGETFYTYFRCFVGGFGAGASYPLYAVLVNNCDGTYVGPGSPLNSAGLDGLAQSSVRATGTAVFDVSEKCFRLNVDCPPDAAVVVSVAALSNDLSKSASLEFTTANGGLVTISYDALKAAGILDVGSATAYPSVGISQWVAGLEAESIGLELDLKPLVTTPVEHTQQFTPIGVNGFIAGSFYAPETLSYTNYETYFYYEYLCSVIDFFAGTDAFLFDELAQSTTYTTRRVVRSAEPTAVLFAFRHPHVDALTAFSASTSTFYGTMRFDGGNRSVIRAAASADCLLLDSTRQPIAPPIGGAGEDWHFTLVRTSGGLLRDLAYDTSVQFTLGVYDYNNPASSRSLTQAEFNAATADLHCIVFPGFPTYEEMGVDTRVRARVTLLDMFGYAGNRSVPTSAAAT